MSGKRWFLVARHRCVFRKDFGHDAFHVPLATGLEQPLEKRPAQTVMLPAVGDEQREFRVAGARQPDQPGHRDDLPFALRHQDQLALAVGGTDPRQPWVGDAGLGKLSGCGRLRLLDLSGTRVTDAGLRHLARCDNLRSLYLCDTGVGDAGLKKLAALKNLTDLDLGGTKVTDAGMKELAALQNLTRLDLTRTQVTGVGMKELAALKRNG